MQKISPLVSAAGLVSLMKNENTVLIDARSGPGVKEKYATGHIEGARFVDLETELSRKGPDASQGGRHPLPAVGDFAELLGKLGIDKSKHVIVYDDKSGANAAARFWWMLRAAGHEKVQVLDGGLKAAIDAGVPVSNKIPVFAEGVAYPFTEWLLPTVNIDAVAQAVADPSSLVIDVREAFRYNGESEPIDLVAGHIPGAVNIPYTGNLDAAGNFLSSQALAEKYKEAVQQRSNKQVIVHCGSGVTACHTILAMEQAGMDTPSLYVGSWSEWSRNDRPVATSEK